LRSFAKPKEQADPDLFAPAAERPPVNESITEPPRVVAPSRRKFHYAVAAAFTAVLIGAGAWLAGSQTAGHIYTTQVGGFTRVTLEDGTIISLNTDSEVRVRYSSRSRGIELLRGEALFDVRHDKRRPFDVTAGNTVIRAVGTSFSVRLRSEDAVDVMVAEGRVAIDPPTGSTLAAGHVAFVRRGAVAIRQLESDDITRKLAWREGLLRFNGEPLSEAVAEFNRYNRVKLAIADPTTAITRVGGTFKATNLDGFVGALAKTFQVRAQRYEPSSGPAVIRLEREAP
jgi:transmembrane sensor